MKFDEVARLARGDDLKKRWVRLRRWLEDDAMYEKVATTKSVPTARLSESDVAEMLKFGVIEEISEEEVRGAVNMFTVGEPAKRRRRPIKHTADVNAAYGKDSLEGVKFPTKADIMALVHQGTHMAAYDFSAFYDAFEYSEKVRSRFCFRKGGKTYRLRVLGMGQRQACEIAQTATDAIRDFTKSSTSCLSIIDNVIFVGSKKQCDADGRIFLERCERANVTVNDVNNIDDAKKVTTTSGDWGGIHLDFTAKTSCLAEKVVNKTIASWERRDTWTYRQFAAHIGLLFWSVGIIDVPVHAYYGLLHFVSEVGRRTQANPDLWDTPIDVWSSAVPCISDWTRLVLENRPRMVSKKLAPDLFVATDASAWGWGFVAFDAVTGAVHHHGERWSKEFLHRYGADSVKKSVFAEPHAVLNAMCRLLRADRPRSVLIGTDNTATEATYNRGFNSHSYHLNDCVSKLRTWFPRHQFRLLHVPGVLNPADGVSRGVAPSTKEVDVAGLRRVLGVDAPRSGSAVPT